jgi:hypothetical protein
MANGIRAGKYLNESIKLKSTKDQNDLWMPQPKHSTPIKYLKGQGIILTIYSKENSF